MRVTIGPMGSMGGYVFVVALTRYQGQLLLSRHRARRTWETQGGHIEPGETPLEAMRRELYEESGAARFTLEPLFDYRVENPSGEESARPGSSTGQVFVAKIDELQELPPSEIAETRLFGCLPDALTYPAITPLLFREAQRRGYFVDGLQSEEFHA